MGAAVHRSPRAPAGSWRTARRARGPSSRSGPGACGHHRDRRHRQHASREPMDTPGIRTRRTRRVVRSSTRRSRRRQWPQTPASRSGWPSAARGHNAAPACSVWWTIRIVNAIDCHAVRRSRVRSQRLRRSGPRSRLVATATRSGYKRERMGTASQADQLRRLVQQLVRRFGAVAADRTPCGKPMSIAQAHALMILRTGGELSQQELAAELCIDKSNVARLCAKLVEEGHAVQRACERDGRSRRVSLTLRGQRLAREVEASSHARFRALLGELPAPRRTSVIATLQILVGALEALGDPSTQGARYDSLDPAPRRRARAAR